MVARGLEVSGGFKGYESEVEWAVCPQINSTKAKVRICGKQQRFIGWFVKIVI